MLIMMLLMISLMAVVCAFLIRGVVNFYENEFYEKMQSVFSMPEFVSDLRAAAGEENGPDRMDEILSAYSGALGVDGTTRTYSVLDGGTGAVLVGPDSGEATPNIITALTGAPASARNASAAYMDVAVPITNGDSEYIVYVRDNKAKAGELNRRIFLIIMEALLVGLVISVVLSFLLSKTLVVPIQSLTRAAELMAGGAVTDRIETRESDEIGILTNTVNDMADRLHTTLEDIENERNKLSTVFLHMTDGVMAFSRAGSLIQYNPAASRLLEMSFEDGPSFDALFGDIVSLDLALGLGTNDVLEAEREINDRHLEMFLAPFSGEGEQGGGILVVIHDVTEQVRSDQQRREFVANVSHELRTPITSVRSYAETLTESGDEMEAEMRKRFLDVIMNESDRMTKIVQDLLVLSRFDSEKTEMTFEKFDMAESLRHVYDALIIDAEKKGLTMSLDVGSEPIMLEGDRARIEQVVINVVSNSVRYTPEGGSIAISARGGDEVSVSVADTGIGIPEADVPHLFDRFYRVDKGRSRAQGGTGLGLSIAKEIVDRHNGRIDVASTLGEGTTVTVTLPAVRKGAAS